MPLSRTTSRARRTTCSVLAIATAVTASSCCGPTGGRGWGEDATLAPGWARVRHAAADAARAPETWVPVGAALAFQIGDADREVSEWAADHTPLFGSGEDAREASDFLYASAVAAYVTTSLAAPSACPEGAWVTQKCKGIAVGAAAGVTTEQLTLAVKRASGRLRPDGSSHDSFPSAHASGAAVYATLASKNLESLPLSGTTRTIARVGFAGLAAGTAWARVEGRKHFPSDVLVGVALGHFLGSFFHDAFLGPSGSLAPEVTLGSGSVELGLRWRF